MSKKPWQQQLREASFRGVPFFVENHTASFGRRVVDHEFPLRDDPYTEDLGRKQRKFSITGYLLGPDYMRARDRLIAACEKGGPGSLVHPYFGTKNVECLDLQVSEKRDTGGFCEISLTFHETSKKALSVETIPLDSLKSSKAAMLAAAKSDLEQALETVGQAQFVIESATKWTQDAARNLSKVAASVQAFQANPLGLTSLAYTTANLIDNAADLVLIPENLGVAWLDAFDALRASILEFSGFDDPNHRRKVAKRTHEIFGPILGMRAVNPVPNTTTASRTRETRNTYALTRFLETAAVTTWAEVAANLTFSSSNEADAERAAILEQIEALIIPSAAESTVLPVSDEAFDALQALARAVEDAVPSDGNAPAVSTLTLSENLPSLVLCYEIYGSLDNETDVVARNGVRHPGFLPAGLPIEVLDA